MDALLLVVRTDRALGFDGAGDFFLEQNGRLHFRNVAPAAPYAYLGLHINNGLQSYGAATVGAVVLLALYRLVATRRVR